MIGKKLNRLTVVSETDRYVSPQGIKIKRWLCLCECGNYSKVITSQLGKIKSCGCLQKEISREVCKNNFSKEVLEVLENKVMAARGYSSECWEWCGSKKGGYGVTTRAGRYAAVHRLSYLEYKGDIPPNMEVCHLCHNPSCFNPDHLTLGTHQENMKMSSDIGRMGTPKKIDSGTASMIKALLSSGESSKSISEKLEVPYTIITDIKRGKSWKKI